MTAHDGEDAMKRIAWALAVTAALAGCAGLERNPRLPSDGGFDPGLVSRPRPTEPNVFVVGGQLVIDQEPIRIWKRDLAAGNRVVIAWALPAGSAAGWLPNPPEARRPGPHPSVKIEPEPPKLECGARGAARKVLVCSFDYVSHARYKYTLTADSGGKPLVLDPFIVNME
jgi:hypothetical protein